MSNEPQTEWWDVPRLARRASLSVGAVRYHWRRAAVLLDLPPMPAGYLDASRAARLLDYIAEAQRLEQRRRRAFGTRTARARQMGI